MKIALSKTRTYYATGFAVILIIFFSLVYTFWSSIIYELCPANLCPMFKQWEFRGVNFEFRADLRNAVNVPTSTADCKGIYDEFHNYFLTNITIYTNQNTLTPSYASVEATELAYKLTTYYYLQPIAGYSGITVPTVNGDLWNNTTNTEGTLTNAKIFLVTPPLASNYGVHYVNYSIMIEGSTISELDLATEKAMMCMFGMNLTYGTFSSSPAFQ